MARCSRAVTARWVAAAWIAAAAATVAGPGREAAGQRRPVAATDLYRLTSVGDVELSPSGELVAYVAATINEAANERRDSMGQLLDAARARATGRKRAAYDDVVQRLTALQELSVDRGAEPAFRARLHALLDRHGSKTALRRRMREARLIWGDEDR